MPLVGISFGDVQILDAQRAQRFAQLLLHETEDMALDPLRRAMGMQPNEFREGLFCWKGFTSYKWTLSDLFPKVKPVLTAIGAVKPCGVCEHEDQIYIEGARSRIVRWTLDACNQVRTSLQVYEDAYRKMTHERNPAAFRRFLSDAPSMFHQLLVVPLPAEHAHPRLHRGVHRSARRLRDRHKADRDDLGLAPFSEPAGWRKLYRSRLVLPTNVSKMPGVDVGGLA
jgi:hypothetical protein